MVLNIFMLLGEGGALFFTTEKFAGFVHNERLGWPDYLENSKTTISKIERFCCKGTLIKIIPSFPRIISFLDGEKLFLPKVLFP